MSSNEGREARLLSPEKTSDGRNVRELEPIEESYENKE